MKRAHLINHRRNDNKRTRSLSCVEILPGDLPDVDTLEIALTLPERAVLTEVYGLTEADHDAGDIIVKSYDDAGVVDNVVSITVAQPAQGVTANLLDAPVYTGTGLNIYVSAPAVMTQGIVKICFRYDEPDLSTGMLTSVDVEKVIVT